MFRLRFCIYKYEYIHYSHCVCRVTYMIIGNHLMIIKVQLIVYLHHVYNGSCIIFKPTLNQVFHLTTVRLTVQQTADYFTKEKQQSLKYMWLILSRTNKTTFAFPSVTFVLLITYIDIIVPIIAPPPLPPPSHPPHYDQLLRSNEDKTPF